MCACSRSDESSLAHIPGSQCSGNMRPTVNRLGATGAVFRLSWSSEFEVVVMYLCRFG